ncbi:MAG TPA: thiamine phosphate synthase [Gemmatimonadales bacterium]|nr:thiamine phosphate synthase [Gemmatimonadales bacterium]
MRPLPRLHAVTTSALLSHPELGIRAAAIAAAGSAIALHARARESAGAFLAAAAQRLLSLARPPGAAVIVNARTDVAAAVGAHGVQLARADLAPPDVRQLFSGWIGCSVHSVEEAAIAATEGADFLMVGNVYETASHPGRPGAGLDLVRRTSRIGVPVIAIGGITADRAVEVRDAGGYGVAAIRALWESADPAAAAMQFLQPWADQ